LLYDEHSLYVAVEISRILKLKLDFWKEIGKENPRVTRM
jgi:hypothetical protein